MLCPSRCEQVGGEQRCFVSSPLPNAGNQRVGGRISQFYLDATHAFDYRFPPTRYMGHFIQYDEVARDAELR